MHRPLVSVIIPAYNAERTLEATIASVRAQTYPDIEIIAVNDGSTDRTGGILDRLAQITPNLRWVSIRNGGQSAARNLALSQARGTYVAPLDADDIWHPAYLVRLISGLESAGPDATFAYAFLRRIDLQDRVMQTKPGYAATTRAFHQMLAFNFVGTGSAIVARTSAVRRAGGYDTALGGAEDYLMQLRLAAMGSVVAVPQYLVGYRTSLTSLSNRRLEMSRWSKRLIARVRQEFPHSDRSVLSAAIARTYTDAAIHALRAGSAVEAVSDLRTGVKHDSGEALRTILRKLRSALRSRDARPVIEFSRLAPEDFQGVPQFSSTALARARNVDADMEIQLARDDRSWLTTSVQ